MSLWSTSREASRLLVSPRGVGTGKLSGRELVEASPESLAWPRSMGDHWGGLVVSVKSDDVRQK
jgi:hypothetical protein